MERLVRILAACCLGIPAFQVQAQTGRIAGRAVDAETGEGVPGVVVALVDAPGHGVTDQDGAYALLNVRPGAYTAQATLSGYRPEIVTDVRVRNGLTTGLTFTLREGGSEQGPHRATAARPLFQPDQSASGASLEPGDFAAWPVAGVTDLLELQPGIEPGLLIRGGSPDQVAFLVDGLPLRTARDQTPFTQIALTALEEVQVHTSGFSAEYGNVRAGLVNLTTKEPSATRYSLDALLRVRPAQPKSFEALGKVPANLATCGFGTEDVLPTCDTPLLRPLIDPDTRLNGTAAWDIYTQRQYMQRDGWNAAVDRLRADGFDVSADDMLAYTAHVYRKDNSVRVPDYEADVTLGGPLLPGIGRALGLPRFLVSYRGTQTGYLVSQQRDHYRTDSWQIKLTAMPAPKVKLTLYGTRGSERGITGSAWDMKIQMVDGRVPAYPWWPASEVLTGDPGTLLYTDAMIGAANIDHTLLGGTLTHTIGGNTFYEVRLSNVESRYRHGFENLRDGAALCPASGINAEGAPCVPGSPTGGAYSDLFGNLTPAGERREGQDLDGDGQIDVRCFGGESDLNGDGARRAYCVGEEPLGLAPTGGNLITGLSTGGRFDTTRDTTDVGLLTGRLDLTSTISPFLRIKTGVEVQVSSVEVNARSDDFQLGVADLRHERWSGISVYGGGYAQARLATPGMVADVGIRADLFDPHSSWWVFTPFDRALTHDVDELDSFLETARPKAQLTLSPRLGLAFPIGEASNLYFNYGHFHQMPDPFDVFGVIASRTGGIDVIGNPEAQMPKTVAYELGFHRKVIEGVAVSVSGFYRDVLAQPRRVVYYGQVAGLVYEMSQPWSYRNIRGFEVSVSKPDGRFLRGFAHYALSKSRVGNFGYSQFSESPEAMALYLMMSSGYREEAFPISPYARANLRFLTPSGFGPAFGALHPLENWSLSLLGIWRAGQKWLWTGGTTLPALSEENVRWRDYRNWDLRVSKSLAASGREVKLFLDVDNLFNRRALWSETAFWDEADWNYYMWSLHLPEDIFDELPEVDATRPFSEKTGMPYLWVPGADRPGDFRKPDVPFQPIEVVGSLPSQPWREGPAWYWDKSTSNYSRWNGSAWETVPRGDLNEVLETKGYIDMPNKRYLTFLNPRSFRLGVWVRL